MKTLGISYFFMDNTERKPGSLRNTASAKSNFEVLFKTQTPAF